jgi:hypothetical protein
MGLAVKLQLVKEPTLASRVVEGHSFSLGEGQSPFLTKTPLGVGAGVPNQDSGLLEGAGTALGLNPAVLKSGFCYSTLRLGEVRQAALTDEVRTTIGWLTQRFSKDAF